MSFRDRQKDLLKNRQFLILWTEQILTHFSYNLINFSLIVSVFKLTKSNLSVGVLLLCFFLPSSVTALFAGMISDHFPRKKIMMVSNILWATLVLFFIYAVKSFPLICFLSVLIQITDEFFQNANSATIPSVVEEKNLMQANSLFSFSTYLTLILGSISVGFLIRFISPVAPFVLASLLVYLGAFFVSKLKFDQKLVKMPKKKEAVDHIRDEITKGWEFIKSKKSVSVLVAFLVSLSALQSLILAISPGFMENVLGIEASDASFVFVLPLGIGLLAAGYFLGKFGRKFRKIELIQKGMILMGFSLFILALIPKSSRVAGLVKNTRHFESVLHISLPLTLIVIALGFGGALVFVPSHTSFQQSIPENIRGRVLSTQTLLIYLASSGLVLFSGFFADKIGFFPILSTLAAAGIFFGIFSRKILIGTGVLEK